MVPPEARNSVFNWPLPIENSIQRASLYETCWDSVAAAAISHDTGNRILLPRHRTGGPARHRIDRCKGANVQAAEPPGSAMESRPRINKPEGSTIPMTCPARDLQGNVVGPGRRWGVVSPLAVASLIFRSSKERRREGRIISISRIERGCSRRKKRSISMYVTKRFLLCASLLALFTGAAEAAHNHHKFCEPQGTKISTACRAKGYVNGAPAHFAVHGRTPPDSGTYTTGRARH